MPIITPLDFEEEIRKINCQASKLPPITERNGYENLCRTEDKLCEYFSLPDIFSTAKRRTRTRRKSKKNDAKDTNKEEEKKAKKKETSCDRKNDRRNNKIILNCFQSRWIKLFADCKTILLKS